MDLEGLLHGEWPSVEGRGFGGLALQPPTRPLIAAIDKLDCDGTEPRAVSHIYVAKSVYKSMPRYAEQR